MKSRYDVIASAAAACVILLGATTPEISTAAVDSFRIRQIYSSQDGDYQFIELEEVAGKNNENQFVGLKLNVVDQRGVIKTFEFPRRPSKLTDSQQARTGYVKDARRGWCQS